MKKQEKKDGVLQKSVLCLGIRYDMASPAGKVKIPAPKFIVFYNGTTCQPERKIYKLSDLFSKETADPELELKVTVININPGYNRELLEKCESQRLQCRGSKKDQRTV